MERKYPPSNLVLCKLTRLQVVGTRILPSTPQLRVASLDPGSKSNVSPLMVSYLLVWETRIHYTAQEDHLSGHLF